jgi:hypothetical protein
VANDEPNIPPEEVETQRKGAFVASGLGWALTASTGPCSPTRCRR